MERRRLVLAAFVTVCLTLFAVAPYVQAGGWQPWSRLDGAWLRTLFDPDTGEPGANAIFELSPKGLFAREAAVRYTFINPNPILVQLFAGEEGYLTDGVGELVMTGPSTYEATVYMYVMRPNPDRDLVAAILVGTSTATIVNDDLVEGTTTGVFYLGPGHIVEGLPPGIPNQDADSDLIPDPGQVTLFPILTLPFTDKRTPMVP